MSIALQVRRARRVLGLALLATLTGAGGASAQQRDYFGSHPFISELRLGALEHHIEPAGSERGGLDVNAEVLFARTAVDYGDRIANILLRPRFHIGTSVNVDGETSQLYSGLTWDIPLVSRLSLELTFGGALHDGPTDNGVGHSSFGCPVNFRESASLGLAVTERWRLYGTIAHMSNASLCDRNSGLTSAGVRLGYRLD